MKYQTVWLAAHIIKPINSWSSSEFIINRWHYYSTKYASAIFIVIIFIILHRVWDKSLFSIF